MRTRIALPALSLLVVSAAAFVSGGCAREAAPEPLRVFAAASLTEVVEGLAASYESGSDAGPVATNFGGSSALARQIRDGAPADVFLSASPEWIDFLREAGALAGEPIVLARNRLVAITAPGSPLVSARVGDPQALLDQIGQRGDSGLSSIAIADEGVPAGEYARSALAFLGLLEAYQPHLVGQSDVRAVLHTVEQGELLAGFVYSTDARVAQVEVLFPFDPATHPPIEYQAAALAGASDPERAERFLDYLRGETAQALLTAAGFALP